MIVTQSNLILKFWITIDVLIIRNLQSGGSVGSIVVVIEVVGAFVVVGGAGEVGTGFASAGVKSQLDSTNLNSTTSIATYPFLLLPRFTINWNWK